MVNIFRRFQQPLLIALTIFTIVSFIVLFNLPGGRPGAALHSDTAGTMYGHAVSGTEVMRARKRFEVWMDLRLPELRALIGNPQTKTQAEDNFAWNTIVLRHEAEALGVMSADPGETERQTIDNLVEPRIKKFFEVNGAFNSEVYTNFVKNALGPRGFTAGDMEELFADQIRVEKVKEIVGSTVDSTPAEVREFFAERNGKLDVSVVRLKLDDFKAAVQVSDDDVKKLFDERKETLKTPEKRKVKFVAFALPKTDKPLAPKERVEAMSKLAEQAQSFAEAMTAPGATFAAVAEKMGVPVAESSEFQEGLGPPELGFSPQAAAAAFKLTEKDPNSDPVLGQMGYYVLQLAHVDPARPMTFDEAKPQLTEQLKQERAQEAMNLKAADLRTKIDAALKAGKSFEEAATAAGAKAEKVPPFSMTEPPKNEPDAQTIVGRGADLKDGELSEFTPSASGTGGVLIHMDKREPIDEAAFAKEKEKLTKELTDAKREAIFHDWLRARVKAANLQLYRS